MTILSKQNGLTAGVVFAALFIRMVVLYYFQTTILFEPLAQSGHDRTMYLAAMKAVSGGQFFPEGAFSFLPLYPWVTGVLAMVFGASSLLAAWFGMVCDALTTLLVVLLARRLKAAPVWAATAGLLYAAYPLAVMYSLLTMPNTLNALGFTLVVYLAAGMSELRPARVVGLGLLCGVFTLGFAGMLPVALAIIGVLAYRHRSLKAVALFVPALLLPIVPVSWHNSRAEGQLVGLTTHGGMNFYMGNHEHATGYPLRIRNFRMTASELLEDAHRYAEEQAGRNLTASESSAWWKGQGRLFWREQPGRAIWITLKKVVLFWHHRDMDDLRILEQLKLSNPGFRYFWGVPFAVFSLLGLIGLFTLRTGTVTRAALLAGMFSLVLFFITARYRLTFAPLMAAMGVAAIYDGYQTGRYIKTPWLIAMIALILFPLAVRDQRPVDYYNVAIQFLGAGDENAAERVLEEGLREVPDYAGLHSVQGMLHFKREKFVEASVSFRKSLELFPHSARDVFNLALAEARLGRICLARDVLAQARRSGVALDQNALGLLRELEAACAKTGGH